MSESVYREGGESCASCVELARANGELRTKLSEAESRVARTTVRKWLSLAPEFWGSAVLIGAAILAVSGIHACVTVDRTEMYAHCKDSASIMMAGDFEKNCSFQAVLSTEPLAAVDGRPRVLVRCTCPGSQRADSEPSAPPGAR